MDNRRNFIKKVALSSAAFFMAEKIIADPYNVYYGKNSEKFPTAVRNSIRVSGVVKSAEKGLKGVAVSDGMSVVATDENGVYNLITDSVQKYIFISLPSGYSIPQNLLGTAKFYQEILPAEDEQIINFQLKKEDEPDNEHTFFLLADPQTLDMEDMKLLHSQTVPDVKKTVSKIPGPAFGIACGDIMFDRLEYFPQYEKAVKEMGIPFFQVFGNHDAEVMAKTDELSVRTFQKFFGPNYYSFNKGDIHYVVLDDIFWFGEYIGYISQQQLEWLSNDLKYIEKGRTVVVFAHIPFYCEQHKRLNQASPSNSLVVTNRELLYRLLEPFKSYLICGHMHESEYLTDNNCEIHICGAVCGGWWTGPICIDGTPNGYSVYSVKGEELKWKYKSVGYTFDHQMRLYKKDDLVIANVWGANKNWKISLFESGNKLPTKQIRGYDPLSIELHEGENKPIKHTWVDPAPTDHMFSAVIPVNAKEMIVEGINQWGEVFTEKMII